MDDTTGTFRQYSSARLAPETRERVERAHAIIREYEARGYSITLRQLYYQHVARGLCENSKEEYNRLGDIVVKGRMAGMLSWTAIEDRTRNLNTWRYHESPHAAVRELTQTYRLDKWSHQRVRPEVWVEKEALAGVVENICSKLEVDFFSCRGYVSMSEMWRAGRRMASYVSKGQSPVILHLGDHDPSGIDMTRDIREKLMTFSGVRVQVVRLGLEMHQVERYRLPPNPAKMTDSRATDYVRKYGHESWELDALDIDVIHELIREAVEHMRDEAQWQESLQQENADRDWLRHVSGEENDSD